MPLRLTEFVFRKVPPAYVVVVAFVVPPQVVLWKLNIACRVLVSFWVLKQWSLVIRVSLFDPATNQPVQRYWLLPLVNRSRATDPCSALSSGA